MQYIMVHEGKELNVPESIAGDEASLRRALAGIVPGIAEAKINKDVKDDVTTFTVVKTAGTKGADDFLARLLELPEHKNAVIECYEALKDADLSKMAPEDAVAAGWQIDQAAERGQGQLRQVSNMLGQLRQTGPVAAPWVPGGL